MEAPNLFLFRAGNTVFGVCGSEAKMFPDDTFDPFRVGLDHIALACEGEAEVEKGAAALTTAGMENTGAKHDETLGKHYVAFKDSDRIARGLQTVTTLWLLRTFGEGWPKGFVI
jgi:glyoxylase I family protein